MFLFSVYIGSGISSLQFAQTPWQPEEYELCGRQPLGV